MNRPLIICAILSLALRASGAHAQTTGKDVADLTLEELMNVVITTASRVPQRGWPGHPRACKW